MHMIEWITIAFSTIAIVFSAATFFYQYVYEDTTIFIKHHYQDIVISDQIRSKLELLISNNGTETQYLTDMRFVCFIGGGEDSESEVPMTFDDGPVQGYYTELPPQKKTSIQSTLLYVPPFSYYVNRIKSTLDSPKPSFSPTFVAMGLQRQNSRDDAADSYDEFVGVRCELFLGFLTNEAKIQSFTIKLLQIKYDLLDIKDGIPKLITQYSLVSDQPSYEVSID